MTPLAIKAYEKKAIEDCVRSALVQVSGGTDPMPADLLFSRGDHPWPLWLLLCQIVFVNGALCNPQERVWLARHLSSGNAIFQPDIGALVPAAVKTQRPLTPARVAELAAHCEGLAGGDTAPTGSLTEELLMQSLAGSLGIAKPPDLDITQLLVQSRPGLDDAGRLARVELQRIPVESLRRPGDFGALVRSPGASLLPVDTAFALGLDRVQALLRKVLVDRSPAVAWGLRPLAELGTASAPALPAVTGSSATATLAYGALYLLRQYLRPEFSEIAAWLSDIERPNAVTITASLEALETADDHAFRWPCLVRVDGVDDKLGALQRLPAGRPRIERLYVAQGQHANTPRLGAEEAFDLPALVGRIGREVGSGLDDDARRLHQLLVQNDEPVTDMELVTRVVESSVPPRSVKAYLVHRFARRASGAHRAFGDPVRLEQQFVRLALRPESDPGGDRRCSRLDKHEQQSVVELGNLLHEPEFGNVPAWCINARPFSGKTTLLAAYEMTTARRALQSHYRGFGWGEVCVFLPMRAFAPPRIADDPARQQAAVEHAFKNFVDEQSRGLSPIDHILSGAGDAPELKLRLLVDALNETRSVDLDHRREVLTIVCTWMSRHRYRLLPPVFTVRTQEHGLSLVSDEDPTWRTRGAEIQAWARTDWRAYIRLRNLKPLAKQALLQALRADMPDDVANTPFEEFCATPGILAAQCTLLERWPDLTPPQGRATLFLALLWHCLDARGERIPYELLPQHMRGAQAMRAAMSRQWRLPRDPGPLLNQLVRQADSMYDAAGQPQLEVLADGVPPDLSGEKAKRWMEAVRQLGLAEVRWGAEFAYVHQQWLEFFAALALRADEPLPHFTPPPLRPPQGPKLIEYLDTKESRLDLPAVTPHHERVRFAVGLSGDPAKSIVSWVERLLPQNWALAAQVAIDVREVLELRQGGQAGFWSAPHPVLQHLRRVLLLRSVDAGSIVRDRLRAGGVICAIEEPVPDLPQSLQQHWKAELAQAFTGSGRDLRERLQAGLLLGDLGDNLRYEWMRAKLPDRSTRAGVRLKRRHWIGIGISSTKTRFRIGSEPGDRLALDDEKGAYNQELDYFEVAAHTVTVAEWAAFLGAGGCADPDAPWWRAAGRAGQDWLRRRLEREDNEARPYTWGWSGWSNPLQPVTGVTAFEALAYAAWAAPLHQELGDGLSSGVPTEVQWEAAVRGPARDGAAQQRWPHPGGEHQGDCLTFNHAATRWQRPSPVGVFSTGLTAHGVADTAGNIWEWCSNALDDRIMYRGYRDEAARWQAGTPASPESANVPRALRGGGFDSATSDCRIASRDHWPPGGVNRVSGLRLVRS